MLWFKQLSIPVTFMIYMFICLIIAALLSGLTMNLVEESKRSIDLEYERAGQLYFLTTPEGERLGEGVKIYVDNIHYSTLDQRKINVLNFISTAAIPFYFTMCIILASFLFYRQKMKKPLALLNKATEQISNQQLDFKLEYPVDDELGRLCRSFETMRFSLEDNHRYLWRMLEERKQLNEAFSHDLRTPLTVLKGYMDVMNNYVEDEQLSRQKLSEIIGTMSNQIQRLENYANSMTMLHRLGGVTPSKKLVQASQLIQQMEDVITWLQPSQRIAFEHKAMKAQGLLDIDLVMQVFENIITNAITYAASYIAIHATMEHSMLTLTVQDDGRGFSSEDLQKALEPYYRSSSYSSSIKGDHFGLGLYICKLICTKHGGDLVISNHQQGGAIVRASFNITSES